MNSVVLPSMKGGPNGKPRSNKTVVRHMDIEPLSIQMA